MIYTDDILTPVKPLDLQTRIAKRALDLVLGTVLLALSIPIILIAASAIWLETPGNPFFLQRRVGLGGRSFTIVKLRGMHADSHIRFANLYDYTSKVDLDFRFHDTRDPRVTKVGAFLRRSSIDELPNFLNVVLGQISLVGPRPEIPDVLRLYGRQRAQYVSVKPGITCVSKVSGRDRLSKQQTVEMDLAYIESLSIKKDLLLLWKTCTGVLMHRDVYDGQAVEEASTS